MHISDIMTDRVIVVGVEEPVVAAARLLKQHNLGALPVCDDQGRLRGILTDRDIVLRCVATEADPSITRVVDVMSRGVVTTRPDEDIERVVYLMSKDQVRRLPVMENGHLVGMVTLCDMARSCNCDSEVAEALTEISANLRRR